MGSHPNSSRNAKREINWGGGEKREPDLLEKTEEEEKSDITGREKERTAPFNENADKGEK